MVICWFWATFIWETALTHDDIMNHLINGQQANLIDRGPIKQWRKFQIYGYSLLSITA
jgi:hypothetical protein